MSPLPSSTEGMLWSSLAINFLFHLFGAHLALGILNYIALVPCVLGSVRCPYFGSCSVFYLECKTCGFQEQSPKYFNLGWLASGLVSSKSSWKVNVPSKYVTDQWDLSEQIPVQSVLFIYFVFSVLLSQSSHCIWISLGKSSFSLTLL